MSKQANKKLHHSVAVLSEDLTWGFTPANPQELVFFTPKRAANNTPKEPLPTRSTTQ